MAEGKGSRRHSTEFRVEIAQRIVAGEDVTTLSRQYQLPRSMMYRWRNTYLREGPAGLTRCQGQRRGGGSAKRVAGEQRLRQRIAELERKVGQQAVEIDFFKGVFKRLEDLPKTSERSGRASSSRSDE